MELAYKAIEGSIESVFRSLSMAKEGKVVRSSTKRGRERACSMTRLGSASVTLIEVAVLPCTVFEQGRLWLAVG